MISRPRSIIALYTVVSLVGCMRPGMTPSLMHRDVVIPAARSIAPAKGGWAPRDTIEVAVSDAENSELRALVASAVEILRNEFGLLARMGTTTGARHGLQFRLTPDRAEGPEAYVLTVRPSGVEIAAGAPAGLFYGFQTLRQLLEGARSSAGTPTRGLPAMTITDAPRFPYRGLHLDVSRHFFPVEFVKRYIDLMARYKLNTFHWHLTDDQGWRIEIPRYPHLTGVGSCRRETMVEKRFPPYVGDGTPHCGFYTQEQISEVVDYARSRYVTIVPEIEMPGHAKAALAAYPELGCTPGPFEVRTTWGVDEDVFCPSEETFAFVEGVLTEVMQVFPGRYIHIGGDEVPKTRWKASPVAQAVMRREGLKDENELQSYFIRRVEQFLIRNGRRLIGWDEILEGGLAPEATVMSWRGTSGGIAAAREGHDVIMTPNSHLYFDHYQGSAAFEPLAFGGLSPLDRVYAYEPIPDSLTTAQAAHILGAQANVWTEYLVTPDAVEYMVYPRALALAEVVWSARERRSWDSFLARLPVALRALDRAQVAYRVPPVEGLESDRLTLEPRVRVELNSPLPNAEVRYTTDGSTPTGESPRYTRPFWLDAREDGARVSARVFLPNGRSSPPRAATFTLTTYRPADRVDEASLVSGLRYAYFELTPRSTRGTDSLAPAREGVASEVGRRGDERAEQYAIRLSGFVRIPRDAMYEFALSSDDGSTLAIGDRVVVDNDGFHGVEEKTGMIALRAGLHPIVVRYFQGTGGAALTLRHRVGTGPWLPVPTTWLIHAR